MNILNITAEDIAPVNIDECQTSVSLTWKQGDALLKALHPQYHESVRKFYTVSNESYWFVLTLDNLTRIRQAVEAYRKTLTTTTDRRVLSAALNRCTTEFGEYVSDRVATRDAKRNLLVKAAGWTGSAGVKFDWNTGLSGFNVTYRNVDIEDRWNSIIETATVRPVSAVNINRPALAWVVRFNRSEFTVNTLDEVENLVQGFADHALDMLVSNLTAQRDHAVALLNEAGLTEHAA